MPSLIRHDSDPRFMSEVFQTFVEMMGSKSWGTLSYRPEANCQQERIVKTMIRTVCVHVEDPLQDDWDDTAEKLVHAISNSRDTTKKETPFYLVHGWDAQSTLKAMTESIRRPPVQSVKEINSANPVMWYCESTGDCTQTCEHLPSGRKRSTSKRAQRTTQPRRTTKGSKNGPTRNHYGDRSTG